MTTAATVRSRAETEAAAAVSLLRAGAVGADPPQRVFRALRAFQLYGPAAAALTIATQRRPQSTAIIDELGSLTFAELDSRSTRIANALRARGYAEGDCIGILCRNHRGMFDALFAAAKLGARTVLLNTDFAGPQLADVCAREKVALLLYDEEFTATVSGWHPRLGGVLAWTDRQSDADIDRPTLQSLVAAGSDRTPPRPRHTQQIVLLTSGTTGTPKGAPREFGTSLVIPGGYLSKIPLRSGRPVFVAAPVFHAWGLLSAVIALALADTVVLRRHANAAETLEILERHRCDALITVPILLSRLLAAGASEIAGHRLSALRVIAVSGSALPVELAERTMATFGDVLYNLYGSTEVAYASIATPQDLRAAPGTVGRAPQGTTIKILDADGNDVPPGQPGRIFVGSSIQFAGYTGGGGKEQVAGLMSTGDVGHVDAAGRLFVDGRDDDMIVSGGENVFPAEIEELLAGRPDVAEAAVLGIDDPQFGTRLRAYVVRSPGARTDTEELRQYVRDNLARYKVPREVVFLDALPRNPAGKVVKRDLPS